MDNDAGAAMAKPLLKKGGCLNRLLSVIPGIQVSDPNAVIGLAIIAAVAAWVPLFLLSAMQGLALGATVDEPFLHDLTPHVCFLFALPLLIGADIIASPRFARIEKQFVTSGLLTDGGIADFQSLVRASIRFRESTGCQLGLIAIAYLTVALSVRRQPRFEISSWMAVDAHGAAHLTVAGWWYALVSLPVFEWFLYRWLYRLLSWAVLMYRVSRLGLHLVPTHPDRVGGLGFVAEALPAAAPIILALSSVVCSAIGTQVIHRGISLEEFAFSYGVFVVSVTLAFASPFVVFTPQLTAVKRKGLMDFRAIGMRLGQRFEKNWIDPGSNDEPPAASDISSLTGFERSYEIISRMKIFPLKLTDLRSIVIVTLLPLIPFVGTEIPLENALKLLKKLII